MLAQYYKVAASCELPALPQFAALVLTQDDDFVYLLAEAVQLNRRMRESLQSQNAATVEIDLQSLRPTTTNEVGDYYFKRLC